MEEKLLTFDIDECAVIMIQQAYELFEKYDKVKELVVESFSQKQTLVSSIRADSEGFKTDRLAQIIAEVGQKVYKEIFPQYPIIYSTLLVSTIVFHSNAGLPDEMPISNKSWFDTPKHLTIEGLVNWGFEFNEDEDEPYLLLKKDIHSAHLIRNETSYSLKFKKSDKRLNKMFGRKE